MRVVLTREGVIHKAVGTGGEDVRYGKYVMASMTASTC